jgi:hypothetical protein
MIAEPCPSCHAVGSLTIEKAVLVGQPSKASCGHCSWEGELSDVPVAMVEGDLQGIEEMAIDIAGTVREALQGPLFDVLVRRGIIPPPIGPNSGHSLEEAREFNTELLRLYTSIVDEILPTIVEVSFNKSSEKAEHLRRIDPRKTDQ